MICTFLSVVYPCVVESENVKRNGIVNVSMSEIYSKTYSWILSGTRIETVIFSMNLILTLTCYSKTQNSLTWNKSHAAFSSELDKTCPFLQLHHPSLFLVDQVANHSLLDQINMPSLDFEVWFLEMKLLSEVLLQLPLLLQEVRY